jgi:hypothetical protein
VTNRAKHEYSISPAVHPTLWCPFKDPHVAQRVQLERPVDHVPLAFPQRDIGNRCFLRTPSQDDWWLQANNPREIDRTLYA